tara:strand:+ start:1564 stop:1830 length:267 start_codon:yes stop_codon:yes gene_type:complete
MKQAIAFAGAIAGFFAALFVLVYFMTNPSGKQMKEARAITEKCMADGEDWRSCSLTCRQLVYGFNGFKACGRIAREAYLETHPAEEIQ